MVFPPEPVLGTSEIALRLGVALACGAIIGLNREFHRKPAGFRTFGLVGTGSALIVLMMHQMSGSGPDAVSRVVQGVVTGIGFLGSGVIFHRMAHAKVVGGLTTAAAVWLTAALGMAAGAGQLKLAGLGLVFGMVLLVVGKPLERVLERLFRRRRERASHEEGPPPSGKS